ncbi:putative inner dynein arm light chain, axonemal [Eurytemora carolleeae]|uniref:putative inner dynein arm light chain, axonemal n=1 Tax=Eurytemora carolleeae TaxID=1294199 RepID=UPI000C758B3A|nr:putative inner dynein arm light chain, axonemal [Eurytemora carolleeae]|eukprot:XP_023344972.1 putative inner dynein arm light chain, axonemal [Eurytemora affinis]
MESMKTTGGISSKSNENGKRCAVSADKLKDKEMADLIRVSGASTFFTLVRFQAPEEFSSCGTDETQSENFESLKQDESFSNSLEEAKTILRGIFTPRIWELNGKMWMRKIDISPASREDVKYLTELLDIKLKEHMAQTTGICQKRRELYTQLFEELIRQSIITCTERGLLLMRIKNEQKQTLIGYQTLYEHSLQYGIKKMSETKFNLDILREKARTLERDITRLKEDVSLLKQNLHQTKIKTEEELSTESDRHDQEVQLYNRRNIQLKLQIDLMPPQFMGISSSSYS